MTRRTIVWDSQTDTEREIHTTLSTLADRTRVPFYVQCPICGTDYMAPEDAQVDRIGPRCTVCQGLPERAMLADRMVLYTLQCHDHEFAAYKAPFAKAQLEDGWRRMVALLEILPPGHLRDRAYRQRDDMTRQLDPIRHQEQNPHLYASRTKEVL